MSRTSNAEILELASQKRVLRRSDAIAIGAHRDALSRLVAEGELARLGRGLYALPRSEWTERETLATVAACVPQGFFCLLTALRFHALISQEPAAIWLALDRHLTRPHVDFVPVRLVRVSGAAITSGVHNHAVAEMSIRVTSPARTVVDCFKFRNKVGSQIAIDALKAFRHAGTEADDQMWAEAAALRMSNVMKPFRNWPS